MEIKENLLFPLLLSLAPSIASANLKPHLHSTLRGPTHPPILPTHIRRLNRLHFSPPNCSTLLEITAEESKTGKPKPLGGGVGQDGAKCVWLPLGGCAGKLFSCYLKGAARLGELLEGCEAEEGGEEFYQAAGSLSCLNFFSRSVQRRKPLAPSRVWI